MSKTTKGINKPTKITYIYPNFTPGGEPYKFELTGENITNAQIIKELETKIGASATTINSLLCKNVKTPSANEFTECSADDENVE